MRARGATRGLALAVAVALALAGCGDSHQLQLPVRKVAQRVAELRGLEFRRIPRVELVSKSEFVAIAKRQALARLRHLAPRERARASRLRAEARTGGQLPVLLGLIERIPTSATVGKVAQVEGVYLRQGDRVFLISDAVKEPKQAESVLSHELTHALEEQRLGSPELSLESPFADASDARQAVDEGSATYTQIRYARRYLADPKSLAAKLGPPPLDLLASRLTRFVEDEADFTYRQGAVFIHALNRRGGPRLVNRALRQPPRTTASIYQPSRWPAHDRPLPPAGHVTPGPGWARSFATTLGAASTHQLFFLTGPGPAVVRLVRDWEGGTVELWQRPSAIAAHAQPTRPTCVTVLRWRWRAPVDTALARSAIDPYLSGAFRATRAGNGVWRWPGGGAAVASRGTTTTLVLAPSLAVAASTAAAAS